MKYFKVFLVFSVILAVLSGGNALGELRVDSVSPNLGTVGQILPANITGGGFDESTKLSMFLDSANKGSIIGNLYTEDEALKIQIDSKKAFVVNGNFAIIDISNPKLPRIISELQTPGFATDLSIVGTLAFIADGDAGMQIVDVSDPFNPTMMGNLSGINNATDLDVYSSTAFLLTGESSTRSLVAVDIEDPNSPQLVGATDLPGEAKALSVLNNFAFIADGNDGLQVVNVENPKNLLNLDYPPGVMVGPSIVANVSTAGFAEDVFVQNDFVYLADGSKGLKIINVENPYEPNIIRSLDLPGISERITILDHQAIVAENKSGIQIIDISEPDSAYRLGFIGTSGDIASINIDPNFIYAHDSIQGFIVIQRNLIFHNILNPIENIGSSKSIALDGDTLLFSGEKLTLSNVKNPLNIKADFLIDEFDVDLIKLSDQIALIGMNDLEIIGGSGPFGIPMIRENGVFKMIDLSDPTNPQTISIIEKYAWLSDFSVSGNIAYLSYDWGRLDLYDLSFPENPVLLSTIETPGSSEGFFLDGNTIYVADGRQGLQVIDVTDPSNPSIISSLDTSGESNDIVVIDGIAYVADGYSGVQIIRVQDSFPPELISTVDTPGYANKIVVQGAFLFVADKSSGIQMIDISQPEMPTIIGSVDTPGEALDIALKGNLAFVADGTAGLSLIPVPMEITSFAVTDNENISANFPYPEIPGHYTLRSFQNNETFFELPSAVTFVEPEDHRLSAKAIIVTGRSAATTEKIWSETLMLADHAFQALMIQGYTEDRIFYLSSDENRAGVDDFATISNLSNAVRQWATDASDVLIYFVGYGGEKVFHINPNDPPLDAELFNTWLEELQAIMPGEVVFVYDACLSGSFIQPLATSDGKRILVTSGADELSWFVNNGYTSFSFQFWSALMSNANLLNAFEAADTAMSSYQAANLEANGDGQPNDSNDRSYAMDHWIGRQRVIDSEATPISNVNPPVILNGSAAATLWVEVDETENPIQQVWATLVTPADEELELSLSEMIQPGRFQGTFHLFDQQGGYVANFYVRDSRSNLFTAATGVIQTAGSFVNSPDSYEPDDAPASASTLYVDDPSTQFHNFHTGYDPDWVRFLAVAGQTYEIRAFNVSPVSDPGIALFGTDGSTVLATKNGKPDGGEESLYWICSQDGTYFVRVQNQNPDAFGAAARYQLEITRPHLSDAGTLHGFVTDAGGNPVPQARIKTDGGAGNLSRDDGSYRLRHRTGQFTLSVEADGYATHQSTVTIPKSTVVPWDVTLSENGSEVKPGDVNGDGEVNLADAIISLQILAGETEFTETLYPEADVDGDDRLGLAEAIFALRGIANP